MWEKAYMGYKCIILWKLNELDQVTIEQKSKMSPENHTGTTYKDVNTCIFHIACDQLS